MVSDWLGLAFFALLVLGIFLGLRMLSKPKSSTEQQFEKRASEGVSFVTVGVEAINGLLNPSADKGKKAVAEVNEGTYLNKKREGKSVGRDQK